MRRQPHECAIDNLSQAGDIRNTLGVARYRAGEFKQAVADLEQSTQLRKGGSSEDFFFLAMAHWELGDKDQARKWYDQAIEWMDKNNPQNEELRRFRDEAAMLIHPTTQAGAAEHPPTTAPFSKTVEPVTK